MGVSPLQSKRVTLKDGNAVRRFHLTLYNVLTPVVVAMLLLTAVQDVAARTVSDRSTLILAAAGVALRLHDYTIGPAICIAALVFLTAFGCWTRGWLGGGDVKLLGATMVLVPPPYQVTILTVMSLTGGVISLLYLICRRWLSVMPGPRPLGVVRRAVRIELWRLGRGGPIPYAVAIATGAISALASEGLAQ